MRRLQVLKVVVPLLPALACNDATSPPRPAGPEIRAPQRTLVIPSTTPQVTAGALHTCALKADGTVVCWGYNDVGQTTIPVGLASVAQVSAGSFHTCALKTDGTVVCWGDDNQGQSTPPGGLTTVAQVSAGWYHSCALQTDETVACWGYNYYGNATVPGGLASVGQVSAGGTHTCALKTDGTVVCWGNDATGQATVPGGLTSVAQVSAGGAHTCALKTDGTVVCWGDDASGQATVPAGLTSVAQVTAGGYHTCALKTDGTVVCWGDNSRAQTIVPAGLTSVIQVDAGLYHTCAVKTDGTVVCWLDNGFLLETMVPPGLNLNSTTTAATTTTLSSAPDPSFFGQAVTFTATVTKTSDASAVTTGSVNFIEGGTCASPTTTLASGAALNGGGQATFSTSTLATGSHTVSACYSGATGFDPSSGSDTQMVNAATTAIVATATPSTQQYSDKVTLGATVTPLTINSSTIAGTVQFQIDGLNVGAPQILSGSGIATLADYALTQAAGGHTITALFSSTNPNFAGSTSAGVSLTVTRENATVSGGLLRTPGRPGEVILIFSLSETVPDVAATTAAAGNISLAGLSVTLVPLDNGTPISLVCDAGSVSGTGYAAVSTITCTGLGVPNKKYQVNGSVTGLYFTGVFSGEIKGSK
jgi:hypothetical protein